jgi:hypothetical protein
VRARSAGAVSASPKNWFIRAFGEVCEFVWACCAGQILGRVEDERPSQVEAGMAVPPTAKNTR